MVQSVVVELGAGHHVVVDGDGHQTGEYVELGQTDTNSVLVIVFVEVYESVFVMVALVVTG